jgi:hypothetical protein
MKSSGIRESRGQVGGTPVRLGACLLVVVGVATAAHADDGARPAPVGPTAVVELWQKLGLPQYVPPASFRENLVIDTEGKTYTLKRAVDGGRMRTDMSMDGQDVTMIELGDERGTMIQLMPARKEAMKMSREGMNEMSHGKLERAQAKAEAAPGPGGAEPVDVKAEDLGDDSVNGIAARKLKLTSGDGVVTAWFDKATGAPVRMLSTNDGKPVSIEWRDRQSGPPPASAFEIPKGYDVHDMDEMMAQMKGMGGMGGMARGMMGGMAQGMGQNMGAQLGSSLGMSLGGPLGAMAGQYIGGRIGSAVGRKVGDKVAPH